MIFQVEARYRDLYSNVTSDPGRATLLGMITAMDAAIGTVQAELAAAGMAENTGTAHNKIDAVVY